MLYFIRHGESQANVDKIFAGPGYPAPLTTVGRQQARSEAARLKAEDIHFGHIISSPIKRAKDTALIIAEGVNFNLANIVYDLRLAEYDMGDLSGKSMVDVTPLQRVSANNAENPQHFQSRVRAVLDEASKLPGNTLLVSHAGVGRIIEASRIGMAPSRFYEIEGYPNAKVVELSTG